MRGSRRIVFWWFNVAGKSLSFAPPEHPSSHLKQHTPTNPLETTGRGVALSSSLAVTVQPFASTAFNEPHDVHAYDSFNSPQQRQRRSRPSSSSGSATHDLRRTPNIEDLQHTARVTRSRSQSSPPRRKRTQQPTVRFAEDGVPGRDEASSTQVDTRARGPFRAAPHPALRISRRTASAILSALESIRTPHTFTSDSSEENAQMSELVGGSSSGSGPRATNGGARAQGPVPVTQAPQTPARSQVTTPRDIMRRREERRALAEANARAQQEAERAAVVGVAPDQQPQQSTAAPSSSHRRTSSGAPARVPEDSSYPAYSRPLQPQSQPLTTGGPVISPQHQQQRQQQQQQQQQQSQQPLDPSSQYRTRASSQSQGQPRPAQPQAGVPPNGTQRPQQPTQPAVAGSSQPRQTQSAAASSSARPAEATFAAAHRSTASQGTASSFPHAFERWETLSSHWEGLTSYWIRKLEQNPEELQRQPLLNQLSRQVTDLSAAGANLFHAVVELQRLRASSERKFQRWFYESRKEQERQQEITAQLEAALLTERDARSKDLGQLHDEIDRAQRAERNAQTVVSEVKRELQISKDEARRAWEELGRREQEERDRTVALRDGQPIVIGGVQVFPTVQQPGQEAMSQQVAYEGISQSTNLPQEVYDGGESPTNTDPFIETGSSRHVLHHEPATLVQPYPLESAFARSDSTARTAIQTSTADPYAPESGTPYEPGVSEIPVSGSGTFYQHGNTYLHNTSQPVSGTGDEQSYVTSEEGFTEEEDETDQYGNILPRRGLRSEGSEDEDDVGAQIEHENQLRQQYGGGRPIVDYPVVPPLSSSTSAPPAVPTIPTSYAETSPDSSPSRHRPQQQMPATSGTAATQAVTSRPTIVPPPAPDYSGEAYGSPQDTRHYYPTRLSDVPEEDERSRVSEATQGGTSG